MTGEISDEDRRASSTVKHALRCVDCRQGIDCETRHVLAENDSLRAELAALRQKIADLAEHVDRYSLIVTQPDDSSRLSGEKIVRRLDEIAASGLAPTGQETER